MERGPSGSPCGHCVGGKGHSEPPARWRLGRMLALGYKFPVSGMSGAVEGPQFFLLSLMAGARDEVARQVRAVSPGPGASFTWRPADLPQALPLALSQPQSQSHSGRAFLSCVCRPLKRASKPPRGWTSLSTCATTRPGSPTSEQVCKPEGEAVSWPVLSLQIGKRLRPTLWTKFAALGWLYSCLLPEGRAVF